MISVKVYRVNKMKPLEYLAETEEDANRFVAGVVQDGLTFNSEGKSMYWPPHAIVEVSRVYVVELPPNEKHGAP